MLAELENISYYVQTPGHNKRFSGHNSGGIYFIDKECQYIYQYRYENFKCRFIHTDFMKELLKL